MIHIDCAGTAYQIGKQHGESCPDAVRASYSAWAPVKSVDAQQMKSGISIIEKGLNNHFPEILEEMQGIADGADLTLEQVISMNMEFELISAANALPSCSNIGFKKSDQGVLIGKTADWYPDNSKEFTLAQRYIPDTSQGYEFFHFGCAGTLWSEGGLNKSGLAMVLNGLPTWGGAPERSVPTLALSRGVLQWCRDVQDAVDWLQRYDVLNWGFNLTLADATGALCYVEVAPGAQAVHYPVEDYVIHTNHCLQKGPLERQLKPANTEMIGYPDLLENSKSRYDTLMKIVPEAPRSLESMESILRNRSTEGAISQAGESHGLKTVYAVMVAPQTGTIWGTEGFPPDGPFELYKI
jgi:isopenicillin-N N-acyltransferase-like protein